MRYDGLYILFHDPLITCFIGSEAKKKLLKRKIPATVHGLMHLNWYRLAKKWYTANLFQFRLHGKKVHFMCNSSEEYRFIREHDIPGTLCSHNVFIDENNFRIMNLEKKYKAVYNARMDRFKRHHLAREISPLYCITSSIRRKFGITDIFRHTQTGDFHAFCPELSHCDYNRHLLRQEEVAAINNSSSVGLCLSAEEGGSLASVEYLLCGIPVVSTPSRGGRDEFFDERFVRIVRPDPVAVAAAVQELIELRIEPYFIRNETIKKLKEHRYRLVDYALRIMRECGGEQECGSDHEALYKRMFGRKKYESFSEF